ncbi:DUF418 domain-containing protein [Sphingomonas sp.]|jgi:uncharacterized protein|uniref:DUF418 domain-containing protein n=1 Tax=Sphingomonas sp. TaxID=28214 RepID=UPI00260D0F7F|nr:DUF418 domain-containing protein [Sphingomonas sp.]MDK2767387.1 DUF418 domain-containing protein [Sphingomonas sp.]
MTTTMAGDRHLTLDTVRGVAVLGILLLNIIGFAMPMPAYFNPAAYGGSQGIDLAAWLGNFVLFDGKMRGLFSFLFGASTLLVIERATAKGESAAMVHYARMIWLLVFGLVHLWAIWFGDILSHYALIGMIAFFFRNARVKTLLIVGCILLVPQFIVTAIIPLLVAMAELTPGQPEMAKAAEGLNEAFGKPSSAWLTKEVALYRGDWWSIAVDRFKETKWLPLGGLIQYGWETLAYMLFGMAAYRSGMLTGQWERSRYWRWVVIGFGIGIPAYAALALWMIRSDFGLFEVTSAAMVLTTPIRPLMIMGWASLIVLLMRPGGLLTDRLAAAGRMAFTNYLMTSVICTTVFYGYGLGFYGALSRAEVYLVVFAVWALILLWSKPWLERFAYGPLEWLWRSLARGRLQEMAGGALAR